jgi:class 3 adenylate cyclase
MGKILVKRFEEPDEVITVPNQISQVVTLGETYVAWSIAQPGWNWFKDVQPLVGTPSCEVHHQGVVLSGTMQIRSTEGVQRTLRPGDAFDIQPGHTGWVDGDEPCVFIEFHGVRDWGKPRLGARVLTTLLFTDIVGSTTHAARLGDAVWKDVLARHYERVRLELERHQGVESKTTGDGVLALFDSAARAVLCAAAICRAAREDHLEVRAGVHAGEVERYPDGVHGVGVHIAARIMALAEPGEVLLSAATAALLEGSGLSFDDAGEQALKGLEGRRRLYRLTADFAGRATSPTAIA